LAGVAATEAAATDIKTAATAALRVLDLDIVSLL
jgi:hypothetical protein